MWVLAFCPIIEDHPERLFNFAHAGLLYEETLYGKQVGFTNLCRARSRGEENERNTLFAQRIISIDLSAKFKTIHQWHIDVTQNDKRLVFSCTEEIKRFFSIVEEKEGMLYANIFTYPLEQELVIHVVVDNNDWIICVHVLTNDHKK